MAGVVQMEEAVVSVRRLGRLELLGLLGLPGLQNQGLQNQGRPKLPAAVQPVQQPHSNAGSTRRICGARVSLRRPESSYKSYDLRGITTICSIGILAVVLRVLRCVVRSTCWRCCCTW